MQIIFYLMKTEGKLEMARDNIITYIHESRDLRGQCYNYSGDNLKWEYFYKHKNLLEKRLLQGGVRLSGELNRIFK